MKARTPTTAAEGGAGGVTEILSFWRPRSASPLVDSDSRQIVTNLTGFFEVLLEWQSREREEAALVKIEGLKASD
jgi:hypothetical protein